MVGGRCPERDTFLKIIHGATLTTFKSDWSEVSDRYGNHPLSMSCKEFFDRSQNEIYSLIAGDSKTDLANFQTELSTLITEVIGDIERSGEFRMSWEKDMIRFERLASKCFMKLEIPDLNWAYLLKAEDLDGSDLNYYYHQLMGTRKRKSALSVGDCEEE